MILRQLFQVQRVCELQEDSIRVGGKVRVRGRQVIGVEETEVLIQSQDQEVEEGSETVEDQWRVVQGLKLGTVR